MARYGVIDLGTNTFHLLIVEKRDAFSFVEIYRERRFIKLAEEGIERIGPAAYGRGLAAIRAYHAHMEQYGVERVRATGTAALRTASNGLQFIRQVGAETGIQVDLISGDEEARLIHLGVVQAIPFGREARLIMDIGGGSVEFIIADGQAVHWAGSFPVGLAVLNRRFHHSDPIEAEEISALHAFLERELLPLYKALERYPIFDLVGASGSFEILENMMTTREEGDNKINLSCEDFHALLSRFLPTSLDERLAIPQLPASRADMFIVALLLLEHVLRKSQASRIAISRYAMKEGMLYEMMRER